MQTSLVLFFKATESLYKRFLVPTYPIRIWHGGRTREGYVVASGVCEKTVTVAVKRLLPRVRKYHKAFWDTRKFRVHDPLNMCVTGDRVLIAQCRPIAKSKHWEVSKILEKEKGSEFLFNNPDYRFTEGPPIRTNPKLIPHSKKKLNLEDRAQKREAEMKNVIKNL